MFQHLFESVAQLDVPEIKLSTHTSSVVLQSLAQPRADGDRWPAKYSERASLLRATFDAYTQALELQEKLFEQSKEFEYVYRGFADSIWSGLIPPTSSTSHVYLRDWAIICKASPRAVKLTTLPAFKSHTGGCVKTWEASQYVHTLLTLRGQNEACAGYHIAIDEPGWAKLSQQYAHYGSINAAVLASIATGTLPSTPGLIHEAALVLNKHLENNPWP